MAVELYWHGPSKTYEIVNDGITLAYFEIKHVEDFMPWKVNDYVAYFEWADYELQRRGHPAAKTRHKQSAQLHGDGNSGDDPANGDWGTALRNTFAAFKRKGRPAGFKRRTDGRTRVSYAVGVGEEPQEAPSPIGSTKSRARVKKKLLPLRSKNNRKDDSRFEDVNRESLVQLTPYDLPNEEELRKMVDQGSTAGFEVIPEELA